MPKRSIPKKQATRKPKGRSPRQSPRRTYVSPLRQARFNETRASILEAGSYLAHRLQEWDWSRLTARAVAARAKVSERTVYRHFATERELQAAILRRLEEEAGVVYEEIAPRELLDVTERIYSSFPKFAATSSADIHPLSPSAQRRHKALLRVLGELDGARSDAECKMIAAIIDMIWTPTFYEHLLTQWRFDSKTAKRTAVWAIDAVLRSIGKRKGVD